MSFKINVLNSPIKRHKLAEWIEKYDLFFFCFLKKTLAYNTDSCDPDKITVGVDIPEVVLRTECKASHMLEKCSTTLHLHKIASLLSKESIKNKILFMKKITTLHQGHDITSG